jgi:hypothetical protein
MQLTTSCIWRVEPEVITFNIQKSLVSVLERLTDSCEDRVPVLVI